MDQQELSKLSYAILCQIDEIFKKCELIKSILVNNQYSNTNFEINELDQSKENSTLKQQEFDQSNNSKFFIKSSNNYFHTDNNQESKQDYIYQNKCINNDTKLSNSYQNNDNVDVNHNHKITKSTDYITTVEDNNQTEKLDELIQRKSIQLSVSSKSSELSNFVDEELMANVQAAKNNNNNQDPRKIILNEGTKVINQVNNEKFLHDENESIEEKRKESILVQKKDNFVYSDIKFKINMKLLKNTESYKRIKKLKYLNLKSFAFVNIQKSIQLHEGKTEPKNFTIDTQNNIKLFVVTQTDLENYSFNFYIRNLQISDNSYFTQFWNIFLTSILAFQIIIFPFENFSEPWIIEVDGQIRVLLILEQMFIVDILINFFTSQHDKQGHVVNKPEDISINQLKTWFILDLVSSIPSQNLSYYNMIDQKSQNIYLRILKLPKYLRIFKAVVNIFSNRLQGMLSIDSMLSFTNNEFNKFMNAIRYSAQFIMISNALVCQLISQTQPCVDTNSCKNWQFNLMKEEFEVALYRTDGWYHTYASKFLDQSSTQEEASLMFQNWSLNERYLKQTNSYQFILQTVTTVGYGDVETSSTNERVFRSLCMIIGVILFTLMSSSVLESTITESLNIQRRNEHEAMIEKLQVKYDIRGDPKKFLCLLGDSVQTEKLSNEIKFAQMLPKQMSESVLKFIWRIQTNKMLLLQEESFTFFISMMRWSKFRRCVIDEVIESVELKVSIVYSGQIGCQITNLKDQMNNNQLQQLEVGEEMGYHSFIHLPNSSQNNFIQTCTINSEIVEIDAEKFLKLMQLSLKGVDYVYGRIVDFIVELYLTVALQYSMLQSGTQINQNWQNKTISLLQFNQQDFDVLSKLQYSFTEILLRDRRSSQESEASKWQEHIIDAETYKQILAKSREVSLDLIKGQEQLKQFKRNIDLN